VVILVDRLGSWEYNQYMNTKQQLTKQLEQATFRGTWDQATQIQQQLDRLVQDRRTGEWYDPEQRFRELMTDQQVQATLRRLADQ
jgi:ribosomal protein L17